MKNCVLISFVLLLLDFAALSSHAGNVVWVNAGDGDWSKGNNWDAHHAPGSTDIAIITNAGTYTVTLDISPTVAGLILGGTNGTQTLSGGGQTLTVSGTMTIGGSGVLNGSGSGILFSGTLSQAGGYLAGTLTFGTNSVLNLETESALTSVTDFTNYGTVTWANVDLIGAPTLKIYNYGQWNAQSSVPLSNFTFFGNGAVFNNFGTFRKSDGFLPTTLDTNTTFYTCGTVDDEIGQLFIQNGEGGGVFISSNSFDSVINFGTAGSTTYNFASDFTFTTNAIFVGPGSITGFLNGNNHTINGTITTGGLTLIGPITLATNSILNSWESTVIEGTMTNNGTINFRANIYCLSGSTIYNNGLWNVESNNSVNNTIYGASLVPGNTTHFYNHGIFRKSTGGATTTVDTSTDFINSGLVDVQSGTLTLQRVDNTINEGNGALFNIANGAIVNFSPAYIFHGNTTFSGSGTIEGRLEGASPANAAVFNGTMAFSAASLCGPFTFNSNSIISLVETIGTNTFTGYITNRGTVMWISGDLSGDTEIDNYGLWDAVTNNTFWGSGNTIFNNYGIFRKSGGIVGYPTYATILDDGTAFNNYGVVDVQTGFLDTFHGRCSGCVFDVTTNTSIALNHVLTSNVTFNCVGFVGGNLTGSNAVINGTAIVSFITLSGTLTIASNSFVYLSPVSNGPIYFGSTVLTNYGTVIWTNTDLRCESSPLIYNYGLWDDQGDNTFFGAYSGGGFTVFNNYGTFRKSEGNDISTLDNNIIFNNFGTVDVQSNLLDILGYGLGSGTFNIVTNSGIYFNSYLLTNDPTFNGAGIISGDLNSSNAVIHGVENFNSPVLSGVLTLATNNVVNTSFYTTFFDGILLTNLGTFNWDTDLGGSSDARIYNYGLWDAQGDNTFQGAYSGGGTTVFNNYGTFRKSGGSGATLLDNNTVFNNSGIADVQAGQLEFGGSCSLAGGTLNFGINNSNNWGSAGFSGNAALAGTLSVNFNNGYFPVASNSFVLVSYGSETGTFDDLSLPHLSPPLGWQPDYGAMAFALNIIAPPLQLSSAIAQDGTNFTLAWNGLAGQTYQVQYTTNLAPSNWIDLGDPINGTNGTFTVSDFVNSNPQKFYRLMLLP